MKYAIYPEATVSVVADSEDANYPATNLTDNDFIKKVWKAVASDNVAKLTCSIAANSEAIALFGTNAQTAECVIKDNGGATVETETHTLNGTYYTDTAFFQTYTRQTTSHSAEITLTAAAGTTVEAGIVKAGDLVTLANPQYGINQAWKDFSIKKELRNGALYVKKLEIVKTYSYSIIVARDTTMLYLETLYEYYGPEAFAMLIASGIDNNHWAVFGSFDGEPSIGHDDYSHSRASIRILEAV